MCLLASRFLRYTPKELKDYGGGPKVSSRCPVCVRLYIQSDHSTTYPWISRLAASCRPSPCHWWVMVPKRRLASVHRQEIFLTYIAPCHYNAIRRRTNSLPRIFALSRSKSSVEAAMRQAERQGLPEGQARIDSVPTLLWAVKSMFALILAPLRLIVALALLNGCRYLYRRHQQGPLPRRQCTQSPSRRRCERCAEPCYLPSCGFGCYGSQVVT